MEDLKKYQGKFVGPSKVKDVVLSKEKTYLGKEKVEVFFEDKDKKEIYPLEALEEITTDKSIDLTALQDRRIKSATEKMLVIIVESEFAKADAQAVLQAVSNTIVFRHNQANEVLWKKEDHEITMLDIQKVLEKK